MKAQLQPYETGAQIRHKSHPVLFCPFNHYSVWVPCFCALSKHAKTFFFSSSFFVKEYETVDSFMAFRL